MDSRGGGRIGQTGRGRSGQMEVFWITSLADIILRILSLFSK